MALMGVSSQDWKDLQLLAELYPDKVQPCFGVHPWKAHLHTSDACSGRVVADTLEPRPATGEQLSDVLEQRLIDVRSCLRFSSDAQ